TIEAYSRRLCDQIKTEEPILIGLSFGGMIAVEVAKWITTEKIILIASAKSRKEIPFYYKLAGFLKLHKLLPAKLLTRPNRLAFWLFGTTNKQEEKLLSDILAETNPVFLNWAIDKIINWKNTITPENIWHIHGSADRILPIAFIKPNVRVSHGGHFMALNKAKELSDLILQEIS
ncbi:MAG: alpha/beta hydrolase, partial [Chitinophagaceae bacterium]